MFRKVYTYLILMSLFILSACQENKTKQIDGMLSYCYHNGFFNGTVLIAEKGKVIYQKAFGMADFDQERPLTISSAFYLASVSKQFTTMAIMMLKEQGKLNFDDNLHTFFEDFPAHGAPVTVRHLMTHTSGIHDHFSIGGGKPGSKSVTRSISPVSRAKSEAKSNGPLFSLMVIPR